MSTERKCSVCGAPLPKKHSKYCSEACSRKGHQDRTREITASRSAPACVSTTYMHRLAASGIWATSRASVAEHVRTRPTRRARGAQSPAGSRERRGNSGTPTIASGAEALILSEARYNGTARIARPMHGAITTAPRRSIITARTSPPIRARSKPAKPGGGSRARAHVRFAAKRFRQMGRKNIARRNA